MSENDGLDLDRYFERFWNQYEAGEWEPETKAFIRATLRQGDLFVDLGAWIGPTALWAAECGATVVAVEPDPMALPELRQRVPASVEIWEGAVGLQPGTLTLAGAGRCGRAYGTSMSRLEKGGEIPVRVWTLPEILRGRTPTLVKMDIEGYEIKLLPQVAPYLESLGAALHVSLHGVLPEPEWFAGYREVKGGASPHSAITAVP